MAKAKRELLKFRPGDCGLKIRKDGQLEVAGVSEESPMIDNKGISEIKPWFRGFEGNVDYSDVNQ